MQVGRCLAQGNIETSPNLNEYNVAEVALSEHSGRAGEANQEIPSVVISLSDAFEPSNTTPKAVNLMEALPVETGTTPIPASAKWFDESRLGMFVHFGLYSLHGRGEWHMYFDRVPREEYNKLADQFRPDAFDARELVALAKRAGAGYVVFGARHHEGFCLWDTKTTEFNSVKHVARRDFVREFTEACREAGLRVGIYYSIMSWQWPAIFDGPVKDPEGWAGMVEETHAQVRELLTDYGQIDYLWYDGCVVPGMGDPEIRVAYWRSAELNAMVRELQPGILINDRSGLPEDVTTPEQHLTPGPVGRLWECCQTIGTSWGWRPDEPEVKDVATLIRQLIFCARHGGNFLLNVGPLGDGSLDPYQVAVMDSIGEWMRINGQAIRRSERCSYTEALHAIGEATARGNRIFFHLTSWSETPHRVAGIERRIVSARLLGEDVELSVEQRPDGIATISKLPTWKPIPTSYVLELQLDGDVPHLAPPALLHERDTGRHLPSEASLQEVKDWEMAAEQDIRIKSPVTGTFDLEVGVIAQNATALSCHLNGIEHLSMVVPCGEYPVTLALTDLVLQQGVHHLHLQSAHTPFAAYVWRLQPQWTVVPARSWQVIGPFPTDFRPQAPVAVVRAAMETTFPPEVEFSRLAEYAGVGNEAVRWQKYDLDGDTVNFARVCGTKNYGICYARASVYSHRELDAEILLACDWWANLYVNGELIRSSRNPEGQSEDGAWFTDWKPMPARVRLQQGENIFLVKCHPGSTDNWFTFFYNQPGGVTVLS